MGNTCTYCEDLGDKVSKRIATNTNFRCPVYHSRCRWSQRGTIKRALLHGHQYLLISIKRALLHGHPSLLISIKRALLHGHPSLLISIKRALLHGHPSLLLSIKMASETFKIWLIYITIPLYSFFTYNGYFIIIIQFIAYIYVEWSVESSVTICRCTLQTTIYRRYSSFRTCLLFSHRHYK